MSHDARETAASIFAARQGQFVCVAVFFIRNQVDDSRKSVRAIQGGGGAVDNFDLLDPVQRIVLIDGDQLARNSIEAHTVLQNDETVVSCMPTNRELRFKRFSRITVSV